MATVLRKGSKLGKYRLDRRLGQGSFADVWKARDDWRAVYPPLDVRRSPERGARCPAFRSKDTVLQRPNEETAAP